MKNQKKCVAIVLAGGKGKRMGTDVAKQYLLLLEKPLLYYSLKVMEESFIDEIVLVTGAGEIDYCQKEIVMKYGFQKVTRIVEGGKERYHSVMNGLNAITHCDFVFIHDGARPLLDQETLGKAFETVSVYGSAIVSVPLKDTIKQADDEGFVVATPNRSSLYLVQTPQVFSFDKIKKAYQKMCVEEKRFLEQGLQITDDAMVLETFSSQKVRLSEGNYENLKVTTKEDLQIAEVLLKKRLTL